MKNSRREFIKAAVAEIVAGLRSGHIGEGFVSLSQSGPRRADFKPLRIKPTDEFFTIPAEARSLGL